MRLSVSWARQAGAGAGMGCASLSCYFPPEGEAAGVGWGAEGVSR